MNWLNRLEIGDIWQAARRGEIDAPTLAKGVAERIRKHPLHVRDGELQDLGDEFQSLGDNPATTFNDVDCVYEVLCDWGDQPDMDLFQLEPGKRCWIETHRERAKA